MRLFSKKQPAKGCELIAIERNGRYNIFTFRKDGETFEISTIGTWDDDIDEWKRKAGLQ